MRKMSLHLSDWGRVGYPKNFGFGFRFLEQILQPNLNDDTKNMNAAVLGTVLEIRKFAHINILRA
jgi:hypothetical protein